MHPILQELEDINTNMIRLQEKLIILNEEHQNNTLSSSDFIEYKSKMIDQYFEKMNPELYKRCKVFRSL